MLLKAIFRKLHEFKNLLFQNKIEQRFCCSRLFSECRTSLKTYFFKIKLSSSFVAQGYFIEKFIGFYLNMNMNMLLCDLQFFEFQLEKDREVCVNIVVKAGV